jgi:hypothetical protein
MIYISMTSSYKNLTIKSVTIICLLIYLFIVNFTMYCVLPISKHSTILMNSTSYWIIFIAFVTVILCGDNDKNSLF